MWSRNPSGKFGTPSGAWPRWSDQMVTLVGWSGDRPWHSWKGESERRSVQFRKSGGRSQVAHSIAEPREHERKDEPLVRLAALQKSPQGVKDKGKTLKPPMLPVPIEECEQ